MSGMRRVLRAALKFLGITSVLLLIGLEVVAHILLPGPFVLDMSEDADRETFLRAAQEMYVAMRPGGAAESELAWHDPDLGWDRPDQPGQARPTPGVPDPGMPVELPIVVIGDSYSFGTDVEDGETWAYQLEQTLPGSRVWNLGIEGYGLDQAVLKFAKYGAQHAPRVVVLGVTFEQIQRAGLPFFYFNFKPTYRREGDDAVLTGVPVPLPTETYAVLREKFPSPRWWYLPAAAERILDLLGRDRAQAEAQRAAYAEDMRVIVRHILSKLRRDAEAIGARVVVVHIPDKHRFFTKERVAQLREDPTHRLLLELYAENGFPVVDLLQEFSGRFEDPQVATDTMYSTGAIAGSGHLSPEGSAIVAELLSARIEALGLR